MGPAIALLVLRALLVLLLCAFLGLLLSFLVKEGAVDRRGEIPLTPLRRLIRNFDRMLVRIYHVIEFTDAPQVILRIQFRQMPHQRALSDVTIAQGADVLMLHMWNERAPLIPPEGPDLLWALSLLRQMDASLAALASYLQDNPALPHVQAIGGVTAHIRLQGPGGGRSLLEELGFQVFPFHRPAGAFGEFWENFYTYWLMWAYNPNTLRHRHLLSLERAEFWMSRAAFLDRYTGLARKNGPPVGLAGEQLPQVHLIMLRGPEAGRTYALQEASSLGRSADNEIRVSDKTVSAHHARLSLRGGQWWLEDLGSRNGTLLNGNRIETAFVVTEGDRIQLGAVEFGIRGGTFSSSAQKAGQGHDATPAS
jgi:hypothetical protein